MIFILRLCLSAVLAWTVAVNAAVADAPDDRIVSIPLAETEEVITPWLENSGFQLRLEDRDQSQARLSAEKPGMRWSIRLNAHSALATRIRLNAEGVANEPQLSAFWTFLDSYLAVQDRTFKASTPDAPVAVRNCLKAVVCIYAERNGVPVQLSGFGIDHKGLIISTAHDLKKGQQVRVQLADGREISGRVVQLDAYRDLCVVQVPEVLEAIITLRKGIFMPGATDVLFGCGCPRSGRDGIQSGTMDGPPRRVEGLPLWQVRMKVEPGSSGSPVVDEHGRLAAVVKGRYRGTQNIGFLIPYQTLLHFLGKQ